MIILASAGILALVSGTIGAAIRRDKTALKALGAPLLALMLVLAMGRTIAGAHLPLMGAIVLWIAWNAHRTAAGRYKVCGFIGAAGLAGALVSGLLLF
jgi:hypothetical protein